ncbi:GDSL-type esterase/lipase family protein [Peribacillus muralis]|uniref:GDSL-type esterase/lipase family protein n=1 Tax=Peribacillus muralis TaxID=264697 RepID=UPI003CFC3F17
MKDVNVNFPPAASPSRSVTAGDVESLVTQVKADVEGQLSAVAEQLTGAVKKVNGVAPVNGNVSIPIPEVDTSNLAKKTDLGDLTQIPQATVVAALKDKDEKIAGVTAQLADTEKKTKRSAISQYGIPRTIRKLYENKSISVKVGGHSLAYGSGASDKTLDWQGLVKTSLLKKFPNSTINWTNSAVGGTSSTHLKDNWSTLIGTDPVDLIIIGHGTNDQSMSNEQRANNYAFFAQKAEEIGAEVLLITDSTVLMTPSPYGNTPDTNVARREEISEQTRNFARQYKFGLVDPHLTWRKWLTDRGLTVDSTLLLYDHIHFNDLGHKMVAYEVLMAFNATTDAARELDERYGGKGYGMFGKHTLRDLAHKMSNTDGWGIFDLNNQLVDWGGLWWTRDYLTAGFHKAKLYGTQAVTGNEPYLNNYQKNWHIIPRDKDYIELEVRNAKKVWFTLNGDSATTTLFRILVNGVETQTLEVSANSNQPVEISFNMAGLKFFTKGTHKVRIERVGTIPSAGYVEFHGFLVKFYSENEPEVFATPIDSRQVVTGNVSYQTLDVTLRTRQEASNIGLRVPFGYTPFDGGFVQLKTKQPGVLSEDFYGDICKVRLKNLTVDNYVMVYIDDQFKGMVNLKDTTNGTVKVLEYTGIGAGKKHQVDVLSISSEVNLQGFRFSDTIN